MHSQVVYRLLGNICCAEVMDFHCFVLGKVIEKSWKINVEKEGARCIRWMSVTAASAECERFAVAEAASLP